MRDPGDQNDDNDNPPQQRQIPDVATPKYGKPATDAFILEGLMQIQQTIGELKSTSNQFRSNLSDQQKSARSDFKLTWTGIIAATILLAGAMTTAYFRLEDKQAAIDTKLTRVETKLDDLLLRIPPATLMPQRK